MASESILSPFVSQAEMGKYDCGRTMLLDKAFQGVRPVGDGEITRAIDDEVQLQLGRPLPKRSVCCEAVQFKSYTAERPGFFPTLEARQRPRVGRIDQKYSGKLAWVGRDNLLKIPVVDFPQVLNEYGAIHVGEAHRPLDFGQWFVF